MITTLDTTSWAQELTTGNAEFVESNLVLYVVSNVRNNGFGFGQGFGSSFASQYQFVVLQSDPVPPSPGPGATFGGVPPVSVPKATYIFPQPNLSFDPVTAYDAANGLLHIIGTRNTPTTGNQSSPQLNDLVKFTYDVNSTVLSGPVVLVSSVGSRIRGAFDIAVLPNGNTIVAAALTEPTLARGSITNVSVSSGIVTVTVASMSIPFVPGQWVLLDDLTNATFLNGELLQVVEATPTSFIAYFVAGNYPSTSDTGTASPVGSSLLAVELDMVTNLPVPTTAKIVASSPARTGNTFDGVSLLVVGNSVELYYQSHPKIVTFSDQVFTINFIGRDFPPDGGFGLNFGYKFGIPLVGFGFDFGYEFGLSTSWSDSPTVLTTFTARYSDNRLTVLADNAGNRFLSLTYWSQFNHPEGILGSVLVGRKLGSTDWFFHPTFGTQMGGSLVQSTLAIAQNNSVNLVYLLQPFVPVNNPPLPTTSSWPLKVASVNVNTLGLTDVPGFYNTANFTWLRGTKSLLDNQSLWAVVGEREITAVAAGELHVIPALTLPPHPFTVQAVLSPYFENDFVVFYPSLVHLVEVATDPHQGQYTVDTSTGVYTFNEADAGKTVAITYEYVTKILPVYASLFNVPPVAAATPASATVWRGGTFYATDVRSISSFSITSNVVTVTCPNDFVAGQDIAVYGFAHAENQFLNGITLTVTTASSTQFTAAFTHANYTSIPDTGEAALLIPGTLVLSAAASTDADSDALKYIWTENDPNPFVSLATAGALAAVNVAKAAGPEDQVFDVGVAVIDLFPDFVTQRHPALVVGTIAISGGSLSATFTAPSGALVPISGEQVMFYNVVLLAPSAPTLNTVAGGVLPVQGAPGFGFQFGAGFGEFDPISVIVTYLNGNGETTGSVSTVLASIDAGKLLRVVSPSNAGDAEFYNVYVGSVGNETLQPNGSIAVITATAISSNILTVTCNNTLSLNDTAVLTGTAEAFLNGQQVTVLSANNVQFTASFTHANFSNGADTGVVALTNGKFAPTLLGNNWIEPASGFTQITTKPPIKTTAVEEFLNDQVFTLTSGTNSTTLVANFSLGFGFDFGFDFGTSSFPATNVTGSVISQFQFRQIPIVVPQNVAPVATFPSPQWVANVLQTTLPRNTNITITPGVITNPLTQFPVVYTGVTDPDDAPTYSWSQISGTSVTFPKGTAFSSLVIDTAGVNLNGETLVFSLTVNDSVNPPFTTEFTVAVSAYVFAVTDTMQLSRSIYSANALVTSVQIFNGVGTITAANDFSAGQTVWFEGMTNAPFLNGATFTILPTGFGSSFSAGFGGPSLSSSQFQIVNNTLPNYGPTADTGVAYSALPISQRNSAPASPNLPWSPLDISVIYSNVTSVKRVSVLDGSDRYIVISPFSVLVYGVFPDANPEAVLMRKLFLPTAAKILDAVHTEQDYTLILDSQGRILRYSTAPFINTDNPDTIIDINTLTSLSFADTDLANDVQILTTQSFGNQRVVVLAGEEGTLLVQLNTTTLSVTGTFELDVASNYVYGASKTQFVRWVNIDNLRSGRILLGTILNKTATITGVGIAAGTFNGNPVGANTLLIQCVNEFSVGDQIVLSGLTATLTSQKLNGLPVTVIAALPTAFLASLDPASLSISPPYGPTADTGLAQSQTSGDTFETLIDLNSNQIVGTFDKSKLRNQFVETGEILFDPADTYSGGPTPPVLAAPTSAPFGGQANVNLAWQQQRSDLISSYTVQFAVENPVSTTVPAAPPYQFQVPPIEEFTADEGVLDTVTLAPLARTFATSPLTGQYFVDESTGTYTFNIAQSGHAMVITIRQAFQNLQIVNSGNAQSLTVALPVGRTYFFQVQASGLDGSSGFSNIQSITV